MTYLRVPGLDELSVELRAILEGSPTEESMRASSLHPSHFLAFIGWAGSVMEDGPGCLSQVERELVALVVSAENRCTSCILHHAQTLGELLSDDLKAQCIAANFRSVDLSVRQAALASFASKLTVSPQHVTRTEIDGLREAGLDDPAIAHAIEVIGVFNYTNRLSTALGLPATLRR